MAQPVLEVVITRCGDHTIDDESTEEGNRWLHTFHSIATQVPGVNRACWGRSYNDPNIVMHFIDYDTRHHHDLHKARFRDFGLPSAVHDLMEPDHTDVYVIFPNTPDRHILYAPQTNVVFFYGIDEEKFAQVAPEFFTAIAQSDACLGYIWGEIQPPFLSDKSGNAALGKGGIMISGWRSREEHDRDVAKPRVTEAYTNACTACKKSETWGMQVSIIENNGHFHKWRRLSTVDLSKRLLAPGFHGNRR